MKPSNHESSSAVELLIQHLKPRVLKGSGCFANQNGQTTAEFTLVWYPHNMSFTVEGDQVQGCLDLFPHPGINWSLDGKLEDGRRIRGNLLQGDSIQASDPSKACVTFIPADEIIIGDTVDANPSEVNYPLVGYYGSGFNLQYINWNVAVEEGTVTSKQVKHLIQGWSLKPEGHMLCLKNPDATLEQYTGKAIQIIQLLSLVCGTGITFNRRLVSWSKNEECEIYRQGIIYEPDSSPCIPESAICMFLQQTLPTWASWQQEKQDLCRLLIDYIALSNAGYLDTRLMQIWQAWEIIADEWGEEIKPCSKEKALKTKLKQVWQEWRKRYEDADTSGQLWNRISFAFKWKLALDKIQDFAINRSLDLDRIGINFRQLKVARDTIAHTGMMPAEMLKDNRRTLLHLRSARFGLQLILLLELGYTGLVETYQNDWVCRPRIDEMLVPTRQKR